jgi:hypothetical protein
MVGNETAGQLDLPRKRSGTGGTEITKKKKKKKLGIPLLTSERQRDLH